jgi:hypothetical protein
MNLEATETRNDCAGEGHQQFNQSRDSARELTVGKDVSTEAEGIVGIRYQATTGEDIAHWEDLMHAVVGSRVRELVSVLVACI